MRLLRAEGDELVLETAYGESNQYAILSHRWLPEDEQEVRYADVINQKDNLRSKAGWNKLQWCRQQAAADGLSHIWADTACIDKSSSSELTESINSMYQWYKDAVVCYVYLQDMPDPDTESISTWPGPTEADVVDAESNCGPLLSSSALEKDHMSAIWATWDRDAFARCTWFTRAWTLQEMIAPRKVRFYSQSWTFICNLEDIIPDITALTGVHKSLWTEQRPLNTFSVAQRMSWASARKSTKVEDRAYSLLGVMGVSMPVVYGEGANAFSRLQEEILRTGSDDSIFAFNVVSETHKIGLFTTTWLLASSPDDFQGCGNVVKYNEHVSTGYQSVANEITFRQRIVGKVENSKLTREVLTLFVAFWNRTVGKTFRVDVLETNARRMILRCGLENEPEKVLALRLHSIDVRRPDLYAVHVDSGGTRLDTVPVNVHGYDSCPYRTFSILRDPSYDEFRRTALDSGHVNLLCVSQCDLNIRLLSASSPETWNKDRQSFVLPLREPKQNKTATLPYFDAELELRMPDSGEVVRAHVDLWPAKARGVLRLRFHKAMFLPSLTTLALLKNMYYCTFTRYNGGFLVGRAFTYKKPLGRNDFLFLEFEHMPLHVFLLHVCRRIGLSFFTVLFIATVVPLKILGSTLRMMYWGYLIWPKPHVLIGVPTWFLVVGILYHFNKVSLTILLAVPFGYLLGMKVLYAVRAIILWPTLFLPLEVSQEMLDECDRYEFSFKDPNWKRQSWMVKGRDVIKAGIELFWLKIKWDVGHLL